MSTAQSRLARLVELQRKIRQAVRASMAAYGLETSSRALRDDSGDTIFQIDVDAEAILLPFCEDWGRDEGFWLIAEGLEPATGRRFGDDPSFRLIVDPIDGTRGLMFDKRSAWSLAAIAPDHGEQTTLEHIELAVMTELPTTRQNIVDCLFAVRDEGVTGTRTDLVTGEQRELRPSPSTATDLRHGFATVCNFFQGGKELTAKIDEAIMDRALGGWRHDKAELYSDQYISSAGQLAELVLGRDRFVLDIRPHVHRALGVESTLCSRSYDLCTALIAQEAGCVVCAPDGGSLSAPLDTTTNVAFAGYCNAELAATLQPHVTAVLEEHGLL